MVGMNLGFCVYVNSRLSSGEPFYVGKGRRERALTNFGRSAYWKRIVAKDGGRYLNVIAETTDEELAFLIECELIDKYRRVDAELINKTVGGEGMSGYRMTPEQRANQARAKLGNTYNRGRKPSAETLAKMSSWQKGKPKGKHTEETKRKIGLAGLGRKYPNRKPASAETRAKFSAYHKGKQHTLGHKLTAEHKAKVSTSLMGNKRNLGKKASAEARLNMSVAQKAAWERRKASWQ